MRMSNTDGDPRAEDQRDGSTVEQRQQDNPTLTSTRQSYRWWDDPTFTRRSNQQTTNAERMLQLKWISLKLSEDLSLTNIGRRGLPIFFHQVMRSQQLLGILVAAWMMINCLVLWIGLMLLSSSSRLDTFTNLSKLLFMTRANLFAV